LNLFSAICDATAAGVLCAAVTLWRRSVWTGLLAGALFAFSPGVWRYAVCAEVFALNNLFVTVLVYVAVRWEKTREARLVLFGAFAFGLGLTNHQTLLFTGLPLAAWMLWAGRGQLLHPGMLLRIVCCFAAGLLPYAYLAIAGANPQGDSWGATQTWTGFWTHVLRREYGTFLLAVPGGHASRPLDVLGAWADYLVGQLSWAGVILAVIGLVITVRAAWRSPPEFGAVAFVPPLLAVATFTAFANDDVHVPLLREVVARFWQQPAIFCCAWAAIGVATLVSRVATQARALPAAAVAAGALQLATHFHEEDRSGNQIIHNYGAEILRMAPQGALLVVQGDIVMNSVLYLQATGMRPDVRVVDQQVYGSPWATARLSARYPEIRIPSSDAMVALFDANFGARPIVVCGGVKDPSADGHYTLHPLGFCGLLGPTPDPTSDEEWIARDKEALPRVDFAGQAHPSGSWEEVVWDQYWTAHRTWAKRLLSLAGHDESKRPLVRLAATTLQDLLQKDPDATPQDYKSFAQAERRLGRDTPEQRARVAEAWRNYLRVAPANETQRQAIEREVQELER
jgi:hypothetical protein